MTLLPGSVSPVTGSVPALSVTGVTKRFGATLALDDASLAVRPGTVHALLGGNGSGKSTAIKVLAGVYQADAGRVQVAGRDQDLTSWSAADAREAGLRFVHQDLGLFEGLSIAENFAFDAGYPTRPGSGIRWGSLHARVREVLEDYELDVDPRTPINELRPADRTMVAIARALQDAGSGGRSAGACEGLVLVLDEPTASLAQHESALLLTKLRRRAELGQTVLMVSHRMTEVLEVAHDFTVFRDGRTVSTLVAASPTEDELVELMAGRAVNALRPIGDTTATTRERLRVHGLAGGPLRDVHLEARMGEIVGIAGLVGSGRSTLLRMLFGDRQPDAGDVTLNGRAYRPRGVADAIGRRCGLRA